MNYNKDNEYIGNSVINNIFDYTSANIHTLLHHIEQLNNNSFSRQYFKEHVISIRLPYEIQLTNFSPSQSIQNDLWNLGYDSAYKYCLTYCKL